MSVEDMKASNKDAVSQIEDQSKKEGAQAERDRIAGLNAAFPNDAEFVTKATKEGWTVNEAKVAKFDDVCRLNAVLSAENVELKKKAVDPTVTFASDKEKVTYAETDDSVDAKDARSAEHWNKNEKLRVAFNGNKGAFQALYRSDADEALSFGK